MGADPFRETGSIYCGTGGCGVRVVGGGEVFGFHSLNPRRPEGQLFRLIHLSFNRCGLPSGRIASPCGIGFHQ